ncbi:hypothetical protein MPSEU_000436900 [Mayamaea pseudoterrestris]|nr:hypothetical protein MPSEU_000436900 [Mayamaea pseudoterrestris]
MNVVELELTVASTGNHTSIDTMAPTKDNNRPSGAGLKFAEDYGRLDQVYMDAPRSSSSELPDWLDTSSRHSRDLVDMEGGGRSGYGAFAKSERQPRRTSKKIIGPAHVFEDDEKPERMSITYDDDDLTRRIRMSLIVCLVLVLLGILVSVIWAIVSCQPVGENVFDDVEIFDDQLN